MTEDLEARVARVRELCGTWGMAPEADALSHDILLLLNGQPLPERECDEDNPYEQFRVPVESTFLEKVAGRTLATVGVLCLVALMIGATLALLRWWL